MRGRLGKVLDGAGWSVGLAAALFAFALLFLALDFQSPDIVLWTGQRAVGTEQNGLVTFYWKHHAYTATTPGTGSAKAVSVYFPPGNPDAAIAESLPGLRAGQNRQWMWSEVTDSLLDALTADAATAELAGRLEEEVAAGTTTPTAAARAVLDAHLGARPA